MGKKDKKNKNQSQQVQNQEEPVTAQVDNEVEDHIVDALAVDNLNESAVLISPDACQQKIIEEIMGENDNENNNNNTQTATEKNEQQGNICSIGEGFGLGITREELEKAVEEDDLEDEDNREDNNNQQNYEYTAGISNGNDEFNKKESHLMEFINGIPEQNTLTQQTTNDPDSTSSSRYTVDALELSKQGILLPWCYAIENKLIDKNIFDNSGCHLLHRATQYRQFDILTALIERHKIEVNLKDTVTGQTALIIAAIRGDIQIIKYLISKGSDINTVDSSGSSALMHAVTNRRVMLAIYLIGSGGDYEVIDNDGWNLAHKAALNDDVSTLQVLNNIAPQLFDAKNKQKLAPVGVAFTEDAHKAFIYLQQVHPIQISPDQDYSSFSNKCMVGLIKHEQLKQNPTILSKEFFSELYKSKSPDIAILMYSILIGILYYAFVLQSGVLYNLSETHHYLCNTLHLLTIVLITSIFIFTLKTSCPSIQFKQSAHSHTHLDFTPFNNSPDQKIFEHLNGIPQLRSRTHNILHYVMLLVDSNRLKQLNSLNHLNVCFECLDSKPLRTYHCDEINCCVPYLSHFSFVFNKLILHGQNYCFYFMILLIQWISLVLFFIMNYLFCLSQHSFQGYLLLRFAEIPFIFYAAGSWKYLAAYMLGTILFYISSIFLVLQIFCLVQNITQYELLNPNKCAAFYPPQNIQSLTIQMPSSRKSSNPNTESYLRYYSNPYSYCFAAEKENTQ